MRSPPPQNADAGRGLVAADDGNRALGARYGRFLALTCQSFLARPAETEAEVCARLAVRRSLKRDPRSTLSCFASPAVATAIHCAPLQTSLPEFAARIEAALAAATPNLLLELALRSLLTDGEPVVWPHPIARLSSPSLGVTIVPPAGPLAFSARTVCSLSGRLDASLSGSLDTTLRLAPLDSAPGFAIETAWFPVAGVTRLATLDHNPIAAFETHPDKAGNAVDLAGFSVSEWSRRLGEALTLIAAFLPSIHSEMGLLLHEIIPIGFHSERHLSASFREAIGTIYLTLHPDPMTLAEALVHEFQHNKLNLASYETVLLENAFSPLFPSPVRPDPRPLWGILLAVHAFLPVCTLYRRMRDARHRLAEAPSFQSRLDQLDLKNHEGLSMLRAHGRFSPAGHALMEELCALDAAHMAERAANGRSSEPSSAHD